MSKYHANCTNNAPPEQPNSRAELALTPKPFCDCKLCTCKNCPDILELLCITVTENSCDFGSKVIKDTKKGACPLHDLGQHQDLLDVVNKDRDCTCEIVAHAVRSNIHVNLGMSERRAAMNADEKSSTSQNNQEK